MKKTLFLTTAALFFLTASFGQQQAQSDMTTLARAVIGQIPDIDDIAGEPDILGENFYCHNAQYPDIGIANLQIYRYKRPAEATDLALVAFEAADFPVASWLKCFTIDRKTGTLTGTEPPFELLRPNRFGYDFGEEQDYWNITYRIFDTGNVLITANPGMSCRCMMLVRWDGRESFTLFRRAGYDFYVETGVDDAETERYVRNVVRPNFQRINAIGKWAYTEEKEVADILTEGAALTYYYSADGLEKIVARRINNQTGRKTVEYYFIDGTLSFIYDVSTRFVASGTPVQTEHRWYLKGNTLIRSIGDNGQKLTPAQIEEEFMDRDKGAFALYMSVMER